VVLLSTLSAAKARVVIGEGVEKYLKSHRGVQRDGNDDRVATEIEERHMKSHSVKIFLFSSFGTVFETYSTAQQQMVLSRPQTTMSQKILPQRS
jgi:hypothetical protein